MKYKRNLFHDKTVIGAAAIGVLAVSAIVGSVLLNDEGPKDSNNPPIVNLSQETTVTDNRLAMEEETSKTQSYTNENQSDSEEPGIVVSDQDEVIAEKPDKNDDSKIKDADDTENGLEKPSEKTSVDTTDANQVSGIAGMNFNATSTLVWPVEGNVIIDYDMENTVYFPTLDLYKCSDAVCVQSETGVPVYAGHACVIEEVAYDSEIGNNVTVSMGNGYMLTYGQLKDVQVEKGDTIEEGELIGYVGSPTKYYTLEGAHLYLKMTKDGGAVNPLDYLNYAE